MELRREEEVVELRKEEEGVELREEEEVEQVKEQAQNRLGRKGVGCVALEQEQQGPGGGGGRKRRRLGKLRNGHHFCNQASCPPHNNT